MKLDNKYFPLRNKPTQHAFKKGDVLVLFGELFQRGYANGLVEEAEKNGLIIIHATVGRRDENLNLRPLNSEERATKPELFINIPLEAGFDLETDSHGKSPNDYLKSVKLSEWTVAEIPESSLHEARLKGRARFSKNVQLFIEELEKLISPFLKPENHIHFAHLMAGGVPRTKIVMPLMNRVFKGVGDRFIPSIDLTNSSIGKFMLMNFNEVTAETFNILIQESTNFRDKIIKNGGTVSYVAYGYHGTEVIINNEFSWQSYAPYIQGWAKCLLEKYSYSWSEKGIKSCVYNCPEILTNSSSVFQGVEIPVYNLIRAMEKISPTHPLTLKMKSECETFLKNPEDLKTIFKLVDDFMVVSEKLGTSKYENWPQHSVQTQLEQTINLSNQIIALHKDENKLMTATLSEIIFKACGYIMLNDGFNPANPVAWIGHDVISKCI